MKSKRLKILYSFCIITMPLFLFAQSKKPNIVFIMADDLGYGELGSYGNSFNETPNLDKLATQGMRFTQAYAAAPICSPTRASVITGQYPARVGITDFLPEHTERWLDPAKYFTINEVLSQVGYHTGIVGKWHLDTDFNTNKGGPKAHGFDEVIGSETKYIADGDYVFPYNKINTFSEGKTNEYLTDRQSEEACQYIEHNKTKPFFLYLTYYGVHTKLDAPEGVVNKYKSKFDKKYGEGSAEKVYGKANVRHEAQHLDNPYLAAMLERIDDGVGQIMETLKKNNLDENTILIFFSDNGGAYKVANNGSLRSHKSWLYEGGIREPLLVRWPKKIKAGSVNDMPVSSIDFYPTFAAVAGAKLKGKGVIDGVSLLPLWLGGNSLNRNALFWHYPSETGKWVNRMSSAVRKGDYKLIEFYKNKRLELYNLKDDVSEKHNLAHELPQKTIELQKLLNSWRNEVNAETPVINKKSPPRKTDE